MEEENRVDELFERLMNLVTRLYPEIIADVKIVYGKLRIYFIDESFIDVWV